jgi:hypothetical protein
VVRDDAIARVDVLNHDAKQASMQPIGSGAEDEERDTYRRCSNLLSNVFSNILHRMFVVIEE